MGKVIDIVPILDMMKKRDFFNRQMGKMPEHNGDVVEIAPLIIQKKKKMRLERIKAILKREEV